MKECFKCGVSESKEALFEAVYSSGVVDVCKSCYFKLRIPIINRKVVDWDKVDKKKISVRDRLSNMAHVQVQDRTVKNSHGAPDLRSVVEAGLEKSIFRSAPEELVDNFNWVIMRKRRALKITQKQLAEKVGVAEVIICALEKGALPRDYKELLPKIEEVISAVLIRGNKKKVEETIVIERSDGQTVRQSDSQKSSEGGIRGFLRGAKKRVEEREAITDDRGLMIDKDREGERLSAMNSKNDVEEKKDEDVDGGFLKSSKKRFSLTDHERFTLRTDDFKPEDLNLSTVHEIVGEPIGQSELEVGVESDGQTIGRSDGQTVRQSELESLENGKLEDVQRTYLDDMKISSGQKSTYVSKRTEGLENWGVKSDSLTIGQSDSQTIRDLDALSLDDIEGSEVETFGQLDDQMASQSDLIDDDLFTNDESEKISADDSEELSEDDIRKLSWGDRKY